MLQYPQFADLVGSYYKTMFGPFIVEKAHRDAFNDMIDAKVKLNKDVYEASKTWTESLQNASKSFAVTK